MILICSEKNDFSTYEVIKWLKFWNCDYTRINGEDEVSLVELNLSKKIIIATNTFLLNIRDVKILWYRRGSFNFRNSTNDELANHYSHESQILNTYLFNYLLNHSYCLNNFLSSFVNKLHVLDLASQCGLEIPKTIVSGNKTIINQFFNQTTGIVTKALSSQLILRYTDILKLGYTEEINSIDIDDISESIFPSLIQEKINKQYEIRCFYFDGVFYSMAIFSQSNLKTTIDFRKYDNEKPNRVVPFKLPNYIETKLHILFKKLKLNSGSADIIYDNNSKFVFLEINPIGQFGMVSKPCNYQIEKKIAQYLKNHGKK